MADEDEAPLPHLHEAPPPHWAVAALARPVFVVGTMRSGTSFTGLELDRAEALVGCPFELRRVWSEAGGVPMASDVTADRDCPYRGAEHAGEVNEPGLRRRLAGEVVEHAGGCAGRSGLRLLSKNPHLGNKLGLLRALFPAVQVVWTLRLLEEVVTSLVNLFERPGMAARQVSHHWPALRVDGRPRCFGVRRGPDVRAVEDRRRLFPGGDVTHLAEYWLDTNRALAAAEAEWGTERVLCLPQPRVLADPAGQGRALEVFLGLDAGALRAFGVGKDRSQVRRWARGLTGEERRQLAAFRSEHAAEVEPLEARARGA